MSKSNSAFAKLSLFLPWLCLLTWMPFQAAAEETSLTETFARYARHGADVWARNPSARISGEGKSCISCHTSLPYALVEPLLEDDYQAYQDMLEKQILKLNHKSFSQIVILGSASFTPFMQLSAMNRREVIEDLLDIQIF